MSRMHLGTMRTDESQAENFLGRNGVPVTDGRGMGENACRAGAATPAATTGKLGSY